MPPRPHFFDGFRVSLSRLPVGLVRASGAATPEQVRAAEAKLGQRLPPSFAAFLTDFGGLDLFHESILVAGLGPEAPSDLVQLNEQRLANTGLVFATTMAGDSYAFEATSAPEPRVLRVPADAEERWLAATSFEAWLEVVIARERVLYGNDGEFLLEAFEEDGEELTPSLALRRAERAIKKDPEAAEPHHELGLALRRHGKLALAVESFQRAADLHPENPWPWFDVGRTRLALGQPRESGSAFRTAAAVAGAEEAPRFWAFAARAAVEAGDAAGAAEARAKALELAPDLVSMLTRAAESAAEEDDEAAADEASRLAAAFDTQAPIRRRLLVVNDDAPTQEKPPARPQPAKKPPKTAKPAAKRFDRGKPPRRPKSR